MFCAQCGEQLPENAQFCPECGYRFSTQASLDQSKKETVTQDTAEFPELRKLRVGYIIYTAAFVFEILLCFGTSDLVAVLCGVFVAAAGVLAGSYIASKAIKEAKGLSKAQAQKFNDAVAKWRVPLNILPVVFIVGLIVAVVNAC